MLQDQSTFLWWPEYSLCDHPSVHVRWPSERWNFNSVSIQYCAHHYPLSCEFYYFLKRINNKLVIILSSLVQNNFVEKLSTLNNLKTNRKLPHFVTLTATFKKHENICMNSLTSRSFKSHELVWNQTQMNHGILNTQVYYNSYYIKNF